MCNEGDKNIFFQKVCKNVCPQTKPKETKKLQIFGFTCDL